MLTRLRGGITRRRVLVGTACGLTGLAAILGLTAALSGGSDQRGLVRAGAGAATTTQPAPEVAATSTTDAVLTTTTVPPAPPATRRALTPTTATTMALPPCKPSDVTASVSSDKPSYAPGEVVVVTSTITNTSGRMCHGPDGGKTFLSGPHPDQPLGGDYFVQPRIQPDRLWPPGETVSWRLCWGQRSQSGQQPPGTYTATADWAVSGVDFAVKTTFKLVGDTTTGSSSTTSTTVPWDYGRDYGHLC